MNNENIAIIGVGALGKRHLQSIIELQKEYNIYAVEVNTEAVMSLKNEFPYVHFVTSIDALPEKLEVVIIATNSNIRRQIFDELITHCSISNIIFEKVLFQKEEDYFLVQKALKERRIHAWVNCARREWDSYKSLKAELASCNEMHISAIGGKWGIGTSGIHMLDLIEFLSSDEVESVEVDKLDSGLEESKRKGFFEFYGTISGKAGRCKSYNITCMNNSSLPFRIEITTEDKRYMIDEVNNFMLVSDYDSWWEWYKRDFDQVYQSQMTGRVLKSIINYGSCNLSDYESSMKLHLKMIRALLGFFKENGMEGDLCPIT